MAHAAALEFGPAVDVISNLEGTSMAFYDACYKVGGGGGLGWGPQSTAGQDFSPPNFCTQKLNILPKHQPTHITDPPQ